MPADLKTRLTDLDRSLAEFDASTTAPATVGQVFNALLEEARRQHGADPIVAAIDLKTDRKNRKLLLQKWNWIDKRPRGWDKPSDHVPVTVELEL